MSSDKSEVYKDGETLEDFLGELEKVVDGLESGDLSLEDSLGHFEKGVLLYKRCKKILAKAESRISVLTDSLKEDDLKDEE